MNHLLHSSFMVISALLLTAPLLTGIGQAAEDEKPNPLRFYQGENNSFLQASVGLEFAFFNQGNAWFGNDTGVLAGETIDSWWESLVRLGLAGNHTLPNTQSVYAKVDAVQANTFGGIDVGGTNAAHGDVSSLRIDKAYAGWRSGNLFHSLGEDFLDVSFGRQIYAVGNGFLFNGEGEGGYKRAAWYIGGRKSADWAGIVRMKSGPWSGDLFYFEADRINDFDAEHFTDTNTRAGGTTMNYAFNDAARIGGSLVAIASDAEGRDGMHVYDLRGDIKPFDRASAPEGLKPLKFEGEYAHEDRDGDFANGNGWYIATSYQFGTVPWQPELTYRYASFDERYDPLFYGATDWGTWFQGEIIGEYDLGSNNLDTHMVRLKAQPLESLTVSLFYFNYTLHQPEAYGVITDDYANEWDLIFDWVATDHLTLALVGAYATPDDGAKQLHGGTDDWTALMLYGCLKF